MHFRWRKGNDNWKRSEKPKVSGGKKKKNWSEMSNRKVEIKSSQARIKWGLFFKEQTFIKSRKDSNFKDEQNQAMEKPFKKNQEWHKRKVQLM